MTEPGSDYLWDRSGPVDPDVAALEAVLAPLALDPAALDAGSVVAAANATAPADQLAARRARRRLRIGVVGGGLLAAAAALLWWSSRATDRGRDLGVATCTSTGDGFPFQASAELTCGAGRGRAGVLTVGGSIETGAASAVVTLPSHGQVELAPGSRLALRGSRPDEHRFVLERGALSAQVKAPPRLFVVETPSATAVDLGCAYSLVVDDEGVGRLTVTAGKVELAVEVGSPMIVAAGTSARFAVGRVGTPVADTAAPALVEALAAVDAGRLDALPAALVAARDGDLITLANLLVRVPAARRPEVAQRLAELVPVPERLLGADLAGADPAPAEAWRADAVEVWMVGRAP